MTRNNSNSLSTERRTSMRERRENSHVEKPVPNSIVPPKVPSSRKQTSFKTASTIGKKAVKKA